MYFLIAIILIAELIITANIVCLIVSVDKKTIALTKKITESKPKLKEALKSAKDSVTKLVEGVHALCKFAEKKKQEYTMSIARTILIYLLLFILKGKSKKCLSAMQLAIALRECWDCGAACN